MRLRAAAGALLVLLAACGDGGASPEAVRESASQETTTSSVAPAPATTTTTAAAAGSGRTTTTRARTSTTRAGAATTTTTAPAGPRALTPAAPGTYRYDTAGATTFAGNTVPFPAVTTLVVDPPSGTRQRLTRNLRDPAGNGLTTEFTLDYRPDGVFLVTLRVTVGFSGVTDTRELAPASPVLLLATTDRPGAHREADLAGTSPARLVIDVLREERVTVGGQPVDTLVTRAAVNLAPGDVTGRQELTVNVDRASRLWVKERSVTDASAAGGLITVHSEYTATLQRLTP
jgi:hypothetical protein